MRPATDLLESWRTNDHAAGRVPLSLTIACGSERLRHSKEFRLAIMT